MHKPTNGLAGPTPSIPAGIITGTCWILILSLWMKLPVSATCCTTAAIAAYQSATLRRMRSGQIKASLGQKTSWRSGTYSLFLPACLLCTQEPDAQNLAQFHSDQIDLATRYQANHGSGDYGWAAAEGYRNALRLSQTVIRDYFLLKMPEVAHANGSYTVSPGHVLNLSMPVPTIPTAMRSVRSPGIPTTTGPMTFPGPVRASLMPIWSIAITCSGARPTR